MRRAACRLLPLLLLLLVAQPDAQVRFPGEQLRTGAPDLPPFPPLHAATPLAMSGVGAAPSSGPLPKIYISTVWRGDAPESVLKRAAAHTLLSAPGNRLPFEALRSDLLKLAGGPLAEPALLPTARLEELLARDGRFLLDRSATEGTQSVVLDLGALLSAGKACQMERAARLYGGDHAASPAAWARYALAVFMVERQQPDMKADELFVAPREGAGER